MACSLASNATGALQALDFAAKATIKIDTLAKVALVFDHYVHFKIMRMERYETPTHHRTYTAPYLHQFIMPSNLGMDWMLSKLKEKDGFDPIIIEDAKVFGIFFEAVKEEECFMPFIFRCRGEYVCHVTPAFYLKNKKGAFFVTMDSVGLEPVVMTHRDIIENLPKSVTYVHVEEKRQLDGFSCRIEAIFLLHQLHRAFVKRPELDMEEIFFKLSCSSLLDGALVGLLRGAFLKTSQYVIKDERRLELVSEKQETLEAYQRTYTRSVIRFIGQAGSGVHGADPVNLSVYLQCKALKYFLKLDLETKKEK
jgi:hypothetical protein